MTLPSEYTFNGDPKYFPSELSDMYRRLRASIEGFTEDFQGKIYGSSSDGAGTYTTNSCYYVRRGIVIDIFYYITWSAHTGTGDLRVQLPFFEKGSDGNKAISAVRTENLTWPSGSDCVVITGVANEDYAILEGIRDANTAQTVQMDGTGHISFHHRYIGQVQK